MSDAYDLVVLGGGCAGLSLSMALARYGGRCPRTLVIEPRSNYTNDRTWCYWQDRSAPNPLPALHHWQTMRVAYAGQSVSLDCGLTPYHMLAAQDFYATAQASIDQQPAITLLQGVSAVGEPCRSGGVWEVRTTGGKVTALSVVDTRPSQLPRLDGAALWQSFYGLEIECRAAVFEPESMDLMNFLAPDPRHIAFVYALPLTPTRALVEVTVFGATPLGPRELRTRLDAAISERVGDLPFTTLRGEHGILPMGLNEAPRPTQSSCVRVGVMAGGARPSTGYAFQRIQHWAGECAGALVRCGHPVPHQLDPLPLRVMDRIFLDVLRADPIRGGALFFSLFSRTDPARVIRFLSGYGGIVDSLAVIAAMPVSPFVRSALGLTGRRSRTSEIKGTA